MEMYTFIDYPREESTHGFQLFVSWADLKALLEMPEQKSLIRRATRQAIENYLGSASFADVARSYSEPEANVVFNFVTVLTDAGIAMMPFISDALKALSVESATFQALFEASPPTDRAKMKFTCGPFVLPG